MDKKNKNIGSKTVTELMVSELKSLTATMDVPEFRRTSIRWLVRNLAIRNKNHKNFTRAFDICITLNKKGVS